MGQRGAGISDGSRGNAGSRILFQTLGVTKLPAVIDFKWVDNLQETGEWGDLTVNGDAAPNDRYNYRANLAP